MGGGGVSSYASDLAADANRVIDCKDWALGAERIGGLTAVRGYALFKRSIDSYTGGLLYTEHWWCVDNSGGIVDATGLARVSARLIPLTDQADERVCLAYDGRCRFEAPCGWCIVRDAMNRLGYERLPIRPVRALLDHLLREQVRLRCELESLRDEVRKKLGE